MKNARGFTLVEIMISSTLLLMVIGATMSTFLSVNRSMTGLSEAVDLNARSRITQERILYDIRAVTKVTAIDSQSFSGEFIDYASGDTGTVEYRLTNGTLSRTASIGVAAGKTTVVHTGLETNTAKSTYSRIHFRNRSGASDIPAASAAEVRAIQFELVPLPTARQRAGLVPGRSDPFSSALIQLRNVQG